MHKSGASMNEEDSDMAPESPSQSNAFHNDEHKQSRPKNFIQNAGIKPNGISGTYTRLIPRKPVKEYEQLYSENIQLKEKIKSLEDIVMKSKTRMSMMEKEKDQLRFQMKNTDTLGIFKGRRPSQKGLKPQVQKQKRLFANDENRRILHEYKDQINRLETENGRLKKTVKYTQIKELETENNELLEEMARMREQMEDIINNTEYDDYEREIQHLHKQLQGEKDSTRNMHNRMKKKDEEIEELKEKMRALVSKKSELEKRYTRDVSNYKAELYRAREKERDFHTSSSPKVDKKQAIKYKKESGACASCSDHKKTIENLNKIIKKEESENNRKESLIKKLEQEISELKRQPMIASQVKEKTQSRQRDEKKKAHEEHPAKQHEPLEVITEKEEKKKTELNNSDSQGVYVEDSDFDDGVGEQEDKVDMVEVNLKKKTQHNIKSDTDNDDALKQYEQEFQNDESDEEVLFQKDQPVGGKKKTKDAEADKKKKKSKHKMGSSKAEKILQETIKYRLIGQKYIFSDFTRDIEQSQAKEFSIQDLIQMLTNAPFLLQEKQLELFLTKCLGKTEFEEDDAISSQQFIKFIEPIFEGVKVYDEEKDRALLSQIQKGIQKNAEALYGHFENEGNEEEISKKGFMKVLKERCKFNDEQIEYCLAEASLVSSDIAHISYPGFFKSLLDPQE